jgi:hypothetical protein
MFYLAVIDSIDSTFYLRYVDVLTGSLRQKKKLIKKMEVLQQKMRDKQEESRQQIIKLKPMLKLVIERTKELQIEVRVIF